LQLQPGLNQIEVIASNVQPLPGFELAETTRVVATIPFVDSMPEELPRLTHCEIQSGKNAAVTVAAGNILEVDSATVTLSGIVHCPNPVQALRVLLPERDAKVVPLTGRTGDVPFSLPLALQAGHQNVQILIDAAAQERAQFAVRLIYRPQLPLLANLRALPVPIPNAGGEQRPSADAELLLTAGQHEPAIQLTAEVQLADEAPFDAAILVDGQELPNLTVQRKGTQLTAQVPIHPGRQRIQLRLKNAWQRESYSREIPVFFRRLPRIVSVAEPPVSVNSPRVNQIELMVSSPPELPPLADKIHVFVNQSPLPCNADVNHLENDNWQVTLRGVVLDREGENTVRMVVANRDGECLTPAVQKWVLMTPPQSKADIIVRGPESQTRDREVQLQFAVHSESPLQTVLIERVTGTEKFQPLARMASETEPGLEPELVKDGSLLFRLPLELSPGVNDLQVTAVNDGGSRTIRYRISCTPLPVRLQIERLGQIQPERKNEFLNFGGPVSGSNAELTGFIEWDQSETPPNYVQFWVNGFMQQSADLVSRPGFQNRKYFHVTLTFSRERQNSVEVTLPGYAADAASQKHMSFVVDCEQPRGGQDLYLVIIGTLPPSQAPTNYRQILEKRAEQALQARLGPDQRLQSSAFSEIHSTTLTGRDATYTRINSALAMLRYRMRPPARREAASTENSVLMIYYHGREMLVQQPGATTFVLATTDTWENPAAHLNKSLKNTDLAESLSQYYGAHVLFLDVESVNMPQDAHWPDDPHLGIIRTVWSDDRWNPETPELMSAMASTLPSVRKLGELASQMELIWEQAGPLVSDFKIPLSLKQLEVRGISLD
jgi:hypothetical protein